MLKKTILLLFLFAFFGGILYAAESESTINERYDETIPEKKEKNFIAAPLVASNPTFGSGVGGTAMYFFRIDKNKNTPRSVIQPIFLYFNTDSYTGMLLTQLFFDEDKQRIVFALGNARIENTYENVNPGETAKIRTDLFGGYLRYQYSFVENIFAGWDIFNGKALYSARNQEGQDYMDQFGVEDISMFATGPSLQYDTRDSKIVARSGILADIKYLYFPTDANIRRFNTITGLVNYYVPVRQDQDVWSSRLYGRFSNGAPYAAKSTVGRKSDVRGYKKSEYVADNVITVQTQYRYNVLPKFDLVGFAGVGFLFNTGQTINSDARYPSVGAGIRYSLLKSENISFRIDYARGKDNNDGWYVSIREAF